MKIGGSQIVQAKNMAKIHTITLENDICEITDKVDKQ
jgi:hypothetical protein